MTYNVEVKTGATGSFSFEKAPPGQCEVVWERRSPRERRRLFFSHRASVVIKAGAVSQVSLGGTGSPIVGVAHFAEAQGAIDWKGVPVCLLSKDGGKLGAYPRRGDYSAKEAFIAAVERWNELERAQKRFAAFCESNGSFRFPDVPAGKYDMEIKLYSLMPNSVGPRELEDEQPELGTLVQEVIVPETPGGRSDGPLDLGTVELGPRQVSAAAR